MRLPEVPLKVGKKSWNSPTCDITRSHADVLSITVKMADRTEEKGTSAKGNNVSKIILCCSYNSDFKIMVINATENCETAGKFCLQGTHPKM
jgi:hypothetical protein